MYPSDATASVVSSRGPVTAAELEEMLCRLRDDGFAATGDAELITAISRLETLKSVASAGQARLTARFARSRESELARFVSKDKRDRARRDIGAQVGLARRVGPQMGSRQVGLAKILDAEMPHLMSAFSRGLLDEYQATEVAAETMTLSLEHRRQVDAELAGKYGTLTARQARPQAAAIGYRLDPEQAVRRMRRAYSERRVTLRPASDAMAYLTALVPMVDGVSVIKALDEHAATATALGVPGGRGALMTDELLARLVQPGRIFAATAATATDHRDTDCDTDGVEYLTDGLPGAPAGVHIEIQLVMTDRTLLDGDMEPAVIPGYGPIPAPLARHLISGADPSTKSWVRRLYTDPSAGSPAPTNEGACSRTPPGSSSSPATRCAARRGAAPRSGTPTTSDPTRPVVPPLSATAPACAWPATTPRNTPAGTVRSETMAAFSSPPPPATPTSADHPTRPAPNPGKSGSRDRCPAARKDRGPR